MRKRAEGMVFMGTIRFRFCGFGEVWEMDLDVFRDRAGHWIKNAIKNMRWLYKTWPDLVTESTRLVIDIYVNDLYSGCITLDDISGFPKVIHYHWWWPADPDGDYSSFSSRPQDQHSCHNHKEV